MARLQEPQSAQCLDQEPGSDRGTPSFSQVASAVSAADAQPYIDAYASGVRAALALGGLTAVIGGLIAWVALGRSDPLATVYEHRDEREAATPG